MLKDIIRPSLHAVGHQTPVREVARIMKDNDVGCVLVQNPNGIAIGIITDRDLVLRCLANGLSADKARALSLIHI